jgi:hypothetical protein
VLVKISWNAKSFFFVIIFSFTCGRLESVELFKGSV